VLYLYFAKAFDKVPHQRLLGGNNIVMVTDVTYKTGKQHGLKTESDEYVCGTVHQDGEQ